MRATKFLLLAAAVSLAAEAIDLVPVVSKPVSRIVELPGEILPYLSVSLHAKVPGYVERVLVDRGSLVKQGDLLVELSAPEMDARIVEAQSKLQSAQAERIEAEAQFASAQAAYDRLKAAAETPGAIAGLELIQAEKQRDAAQAVAGSREQVRASAEAAVRALRDLQAYLKIAAPFDGVVTDRLIHPGALVGPGNDVALLNVQQVSRLRLAVPVPEEDVSGIVNGASVSFQVPAWPDRTYSGTIARISHALDPQTRTMPVELDLMNRDGSLAPGMYPRVNWPVRGAQPALWVPRTSVVTTTERTFVIRSQNGAAQWVDVKTGISEGDLIEVIGRLSTDSAHNATRPNAACCALKPGELVVRRATDEIREGSPLQSNTK